MYVKFRKIFNLTTNSVKGNGAHNIMLSSELIITFQSVRLGQLDDVTVLYKAWKKRKAWKSYLLCNHMSVKLLSKRIPVKAIALLLYSSPQLTWRVYK